MNKLQFESFDTKIVRLQCWKFVLHLLRLESVNGSVSRLSGYYLTLVWDPSLGALHLFIIDHCILLLSTYHPPSKTEADILFLNVSC